MPAHRNFASKSLRHRPESRSSVPTSHCSILPELSRSAGSSAIRADARICALLRADPIAYAPKRSASTHGCRSSCISQIGQSTFAWEWRQPELRRRSCCGATWLVSRSPDPALRPATSGWSYVYRAPDAATILSDQFVKSHCFNAIHGYGAETGLVGLEFRPSRVSAQPELSGVLWLDPKGNSLRSLNFDYVNLPIPLRIARTTGRLEFQQLPGGQWIVPRWYIRMPRVARAASTDVRSPAVSRDSLVGYQEVGGEARPTGTARVGPAFASASRAGTAQAGDAPQPASQSVLVGIVYDSSSGRALSGVRVSTGGGRFKTLTNAGGAYELAIDGALNDTIVFEHPRLRLFHVAERVQSISLPAGSRGQASVIVPSYGTLRKNLCGQNETATEAQGMMAGYVRDATGKALPRAHVWATWQMLWVEQNGRLISTNQQRTTETDSNSDGSYVLCGFTRGAQITAKVGIAGKNTLQERLVLPANMVLEHDFQFGAR